MTVVIKNSIIKAMEGWRRGGETRLFPGVEFQGALTPGVAPENAEVPQGLVAGGGKVSDDHLLWHGNSG